MARSFITSAAQLPVDADVSWRGEIDVGVRGHAGLEFVIGIVDIDLDAIDERDAFLVGLNALGRELGVEEMNEMRP
jgi:hypothetical protein